MEVSHCYKCSSVEDLSLKKRQRGIMTFICKPCRNEAMRQYKARQAPKVEYVGINPIQWAKWAQESRKRILEHHRAAC